MATPGWRFALGYLLSVVIAGRGHMGEWYCRRHWGWLPYAHLLRWSWPIVKYVPRLWNWFVKIEVRDSHIHGNGVFATCHIKTGEIVARYHGRPVDWSSLYIGHRDTYSGETQRYEISGKLKYLNHAKNPNAKLHNIELTALRPIRMGVEITIDYGVERTSECDKREDRKDTRNAGDASSREPLSKVA